MTVFYAIQICRFGKVAFFFHVKSFCFFFLSAFPFPVLIFYLVKTNVSLELIVWSGMRLVFCPPLLNVWYHGIWKWSRVFPELELQLPLLDNRPRSKKGLSCIVYLFITKEIIQYIWDPINASCFLSNFIFSKARVPKG